jgi:short-subunit dehydrogenase
MTLNVKGKTVLITGASSGIGAHFAQAMATRGANLVLVARREDRLAVLADQIKRTHSVTVTVIAQDLSAPGAGAILESTLKKKAVTVDILMNNAGFGTNNRLVAEDRERLRHEINLNVATLVDLTAAFLPGMISRDFGAVVNVASTASFQPVPGMAVYAASKAFVRSFTEAVWGEVSSPNVRVLAVSPGATQTEFFDVAGGKPSGAMMPVSAVVDTVLKALDSKKSTPSVVVGGRNSLTSSLTKFFPKKMVIKLAGSMFLPKL